MYIKPLQTGISLPAKPLEQKKKEVGVVERVEKPEEDKDSQENKKEKKRPRSERSLDISV